MAQASHVATTACPPVSLPSLSLSPTSLLTHWTLTLLSYSFVLQAGIDHLAGTKHCRGHYGGPQVRKIPRKEPTHLSPGEQINKWCIYTTEDCSAIKGNNLLRCARAGMDVKELCAV